MTALAPTASILTEAAREPAPEPRSILVADDDPDILEFLEVVLASDGHRVAAALDGAEALRMMRRRAAAPFDIALVDINMPLVNGISLIREMERLHPETLAVIMTGEATPDQIQTAYHVGADTLIRKPLEAGRVRRFIQSLDATLEEHRRAVRRRQRGPIENGLAQWKLFWRAPPGTSEGSRRGELFTLLVAIVLGFLAWKALDVFASLLQSTLSRHDGPFRSAPWDGGRRIP